MDTLATEAATEEIARLLMVLLVDDQPFVAGLLRHQLTHEKEIDFHYCQDPFQADSTTEKTAAT